MIMQGKGHWLMIPFDLNINDIVIWEQIIKLLNSEGNPLMIDDTDAVKKYDSLSSCSPYIQPDGNLIFIGYYKYSVSSEYYLRIYKWSKVGVQLNFTDINMTQEYKDLDYNELFTYRGVFDDGIYVDGYLDIVGYNRRLDEQYNEYVYTSRWIRVNDLGEKVQDMNIKPKIGNSTWFEKKGMDSGNIERRSVISSLHRSANRIHLRYGGTQSGTSFYQVLSHQGNLLELYRMYFALSSSSYTSYYNILGTDYWITRYFNSNKDKLLIQYMLTSRPIGAHTKLAQPVEKTDANTMKIQYMFVIDLLTYGEDYY